MVRVRALIIDTGDPTVNFCLSLEAITHKIKNTKHFSVAEQKRPDLILKAPHTLPRHPTALSDHSPTTLLPLVCPVGQKSCIEHTALTCCQLHSSMYVLRLREMQ